MTALKLYILRLLIGSILCTTVLSLVHEKQYEAQLRTVCSIFLTLILVSPLGDISLGFDLSVLKEISSDGNVYSVYGTTMANHKQIERISEALETYILDKAALENTTLSVDVTLGEDFVPVRAELQGEWDLHTKQILEKMIEKELGIAKENQIWIG